MLFWNIAMGSQTGIGVFQQISPSLPEAASNLGGQYSPYLPGIEIPY
jgi:ABC-type Fe3+ transport system permease subunit